MSDDKQEEVPLSRTLWNLLPLILVALYLCHYSPSKRPAFKLEQCGKHLHEIGVMIEKDRLSSDDKLYGKDLKEIFGQHPIPACPVGGKEAYIEGYQVSPDRRSYLLVCKGDHHKDAGVPSDYPRIAFSIQEADKAENKTSTPDSTATPAASASPVVTGTPGASATPAAATTPVVKASATPHAEGQDKEHKPQESAGQKEQKDGKGQAAPPAASATPKSK